MQVAHFGDPPATKSLPPAQREAQLPLVVRVRLLSQGQRVSALQLTPAFPMLLLAQMATALPMAGAVPPVMQTAATLR